MFAYEREADQALVLAAGVPRAWVTGGKRVAVKRLPTYYGVLTYRLESDGPDRLRLQVSGDLRLPPGKVVVRPPLERPLQAVRVNGRAIDTFTADQAIIAELPANVVLDSVSAGEPTPTSRPQPTPSPQPTATSSEPTPPEEEEKPKD
jgi:hypothetical protein